MKITILAFTNSPIHQLTNYCLAQKTNLIPNCTWRDDVAVWVICVASGMRVPSMLNSAAEFGVAKFARLNRLKISIRNCRFCLPTNVFLKIDMSTIFRSGPRRLLRPTVPYSPGGGSTNAFASNQLVGDPTIALLALNPGAQSGFCGFGSLDRSLAQSKPMSGVNGTPLA